MKRYKLVEFLSNLNVKPPARMQSPIDDCLATVLDRDSKICGLCRYFSKDFPKNVITTSELNFLRISCYLSTCFVCFFSANTADKKHVKPQKFY